MVKVKFLKKFGKFQPGDVTEVTDSKAYYWRVVGVAEPHFEIEHKEAVKSAAPIKEPVKTSAEKATKNKKPEKVTIKKPPSKKRIKRPGS